MIKAAVVLFMQLKALKVSERSWSGLNPEKVNAGEQNEMSYCSSVCSSVQLVQTKDKNTELLPTNQAE